MFFYHFVGPHNLELRGQALLRHRKAQDQPAANIRQDALNLLK